MIKPVEGLAVEIRMLGKNVNLTILNHYNPVLTAFAYPDGSLVAWRTVWGIEGPKHAAWVTGEEISQLMGWSP